MSEIELKNNENILRIIDDIYRNTDQTKKSDYLSSTTDTGDFHSYNIDKEGSGLDISIAIVEDGIDDSTVHKHNKHNKHNKHKEKVPNKLKKGKKSSEPKRQSRFKAFCHSYRLELKFIGYLFLSILMPFLTIAMSAMLITTNKGILIIFGMLLFMTFTILSSINAFRYLAKVIALRTSGATGETREALIIKLENKESKGSYSKDKQK